jgi:hypothetical protein
MDPFSNITICSHPVQRGFSRRLRFDVLHKGILSTEIVDENVRASGWSEMACFSYLFLLE